MTNKKRTLPDGCYKIKILDVMNCKNMSNNGHHLKIAYDIVSSISPRLRCADTNI